jgi:hypothetical protein
MAATAFNNTMVIYIPRMNMFWGTKEKVKEVFLKQNIGKVSRVDIVKKRVTKERKRERKHVGGDYVRSAHVYFTTWFDTESNRNLQARIMDPEKEARVVIDDPWYWLLLESNRNHDEERLQRTESLINTTMNLVNIVNNKNKETKAQLSKQNEAIQHLQDFCITQGLEIPFWDTRNPPAEEVSSMEALAANTAAKAAEYVLNGEYEDDDEEVSLMEAESTATSVAEYVLNEYDEDRHFYPIINEPAVYERTYSAGDIMPFRDREGDYHEMVHHYGQEAADAYFSYYYSN